MRIKGGEGEDDEPSMEPIQRRKQFKLATRRGRFPRVLRLRTIGVKVRSEMRRALKEARGE